MANIPPIKSEATVRNVLTEPLTTVGVKHKAFHFSLEREKKDGLLKKATFGKLTVATADLANAFIKTYNKKIKIDDQTLVLQLNQYPVDENVAVRLELQQGGLLNKDDASPPEEVQKTTPKFRFKSLECGLFEGGWGGIEKFSPQFRMPRCGEFQLRNNKTLARLVLDPEADGGRLAWDHSEEDSIFSTLWQNDTTVQVVRIYLSNAEIIVGTQKKPFVIFSLTWAPRFYRETSRDAPLPAIFRTWCLNDQHRKVAPYCYVYRIELQDPKDVDKFLNLRKQMRRVTVRQMDIPYSYITKFMTPEYDESNFVRLEKEVFAKLPYSCAFHIHAIVANGFLPPAFILRFSPHIFRLQAHLGKERRLALVLQEFYRRIKRHSPMVVMSAGQPRFETFGEAFYVNLLKDTLDVVKKRTIQTEKFPKAKELDEEMFWVYHAYVTPTSMYLSGPNRVPGNRVLRMFSREYMEYFLRVTFVDENGQELSYERNVKFDPIYERFKKFLSRDGFCIAGRTFSFLGFSQSSLKTHACWFMSDFLVGFKGWHASSVLRELGDFENIRCVGRCAARIGQAFSDTRSPVQISSDSIVHIDDIKKKKYVFSDGVGRISQELVEEIWEKQGINDAKVKPVVFQIRFAGSKGVVALDSRLQGRRLELRPSMIKFSSKANFLEVCVAARPLKLYLNRPLITILEDLGVNTAHIEFLQKQALEKIVEVKSPKYAASFFKHYGVGTGAVDIPQIILLLDKIGINYKEIDFLFKAHHLAMYVALKELKYKARIPVPLGYTLMGVIDETGYLEEGEVYCSCENEEVVDVLQGRCVVTRSPALLAGDVQYAHAVVVPNDSPLSHLRNVIVFSQNGERPLCNMLSGGDLDGDLYQIIFDPELFPRRIGKPADYLPNEPIVLDRPCTLDDMGHFFVDYMQNDRVGQLSTIHLETSDFEPLGVFHPACVALARMATVALDYGKSGIMVDMSELPRQGARPKPDFMIYEPRVLTFERSTIDREIEEEVGEDTDQAPRFYRSQKVLGRLFRSIDEVAVVTSWSEEMRSDEKSSGKVWTYLMSKYPRSRWAAELSFASDLYLWYQDQLKEIMLDYAPSRWQHLKEEEIFTGNMLGRGRRTKRQFETIEMVRKEYDSLVHAMVDSLEHAKSGTHGKKVNRAMACLSLVQKQPWGSFACIMARVVLQEILD